MIIDSTGSSKFTIGETQEYKTTIDIENLDFIATLLSSNLYSNPEASFIREIVSNGWDSHVEAGNTNTPLLVRVRRGIDYNYNITIRDYGTGLSKEQFENLFCKIGSSTKRESNAYHGCFGLGHLSPLAVSKVCYITSYYDGVARLYVMTKNGNSITTNLMNTTSTNEKNGIEITIKGIEGISSYKEALYRLAFFPNVYIDGVFSEINNIKIKKYKYFTAANNVFKDKLLLGNVLYPLDDSILPVECKDFYRTIVDSGIVFNFNIGELQVTPNRESIIYNTKTNELIISRVKDAIEEITELLRKGVEKDYSDPIEYFNILHKHIYYDFIDNTIKHWGDYIPSLVLKMFNFNITLRGKKVINIDNIYRVENFLPSFRFVVSRDRIFKDDSRWTTRRYIKENLPVVIIPKEQKLGKYLNDFIIKNYSNKIFISPISKEDYKTEYLQKYHSYNRTFDSLDEEFIVECAYDHLMSRCTSVNFDKNTDFIKFKEDAKAYAKANKVPANTGKVILSIWKTSSYGEGHHYFKREFASYNEALTYIKELKGGTLYRNLDDTNIASCACRLGYNVISANKKVLEWLNKEDFTSRISVDTIFNNKNMVVLNTIREAGFSVDIPKTFINSLNERLSTVAKNAINTFRIYSTYSTSCYLDSCKVDETLLNDLKDIMNCYSIYKDLNNTINANVADTNINEILCYIIMKQKGYKIGYNCYKKIKNNKLLSLLCKK
jgi:hypothetical protein